MSKKGELHPGSVAHRLQAFFAACPDEELDYAGLEAKFGCSSAAARSAVMKLKKRGLIESIHLIRPKSKGRAS